MNKFALGMLLAVLLSAMLYDIFFRRGVPLIEAGPRVDRSRNL